MFSVIVPSLGITISFSPRDVLPALKRTLLRISLGMWFVNVKEALTRSLTKQYDGIDKDCISMSGRNVSVPTPTE